MKIAILTLWDSNNYGAFLQAYSLYHLIEIYGHDVSFYSLTKEQRRPLPYITKYITRIPYYYRLLKGYKQSKKKFRLCDINEKVDLAIIGADELWNVNNNSFRHYKEYLGYNLNAKKIITYAVSCNGVEKDDFINVYPNDRLLKINTISVRDDSTQDLVRDLERESIKVLDPTFLLNDYGDIEKKVEYRDYILVYGYCFSEEEIEKIKNLSRKTGLEIISVGMYLPWTDRKVPASPEEFLGMVRNATYLVTSTFHGTVFSIIYQKDFVSVCRENKKIKDLLSDFQMEYRDVTDVGDYYQICKSRIDYESHKHILIARKSASIHFLQEEMI